MTFQAAYGNERVKAHLFLHNAPSPYQIVVFFGSSAIMESGQKDRGPGVPVSVHREIRPSGGDSGIQRFTGTRADANGPCHVIRRRDQRGSDGRWISGRTVDYMKTRTDLDTRKPDFYGVSIGATHGVRLVDD